VETYEEIKSLLYGGGGSLDSQEREPKVYNEVFMCLKRAKSATFRANK